VRTKCVVSVAGWSWSLDGAVLFNLLRSLLRDVLFDLPTAVQPSTVRGEREEKASVKGLVRGESER
jgi:hypothetical protein